MALRPKERDHRGRNITLGYPARTVHGSVHGSLISELPFDDPQPWREVSCEAIRTPDENRDVVTMRQKFADNRVTNASRSPNSVTNIGESSAVVTLLRAAPVVHLVGAVCDGTGS